ncbi:hypothetical protein JR316_0009997 [Psilocybe cubensis]|uniref:Uncharacterized protein n=2 Tax=Psilocybe cubensis TaxID=181762 RepID=A0A8H8CGE2_PSICU|nr:hypothetical protein JR316_0009997 [Psilocybe cubensis]KAH9477768.1 hypothetical protein JR316_0009997 [Psilocybe cubensis]
MEAARDTNGTASEQVSEGAHTTQFKYLSAATIYLSIFALILLLASLIIVSISSPLGETHGWQYLATFRLLTISVLMIVSLAVSTVYIYVDCPTLLGIIVNGTLLRYYTIQLDGFHAIYPWQSLCMPYRHYPMYPGGPRDPFPPVIYPHPACKDWKLALKILMGIAAGAAILVGLIYLYILLVLLRKSRFWRRETWTIPPGTHVSLSFSLKRTSTAAPSSEPEHGPIYI